MRPACHFVDGPLHRRAARGFPINTNSADYFVDLHYEEAGVTRPTSGAFVQIHHYFHVH